MVNEITALVIGYLLGSIPSAYIITRITLGKDIRHLGGGNVGGLNTFSEVGFLPAVMVIFADVGKGAATVAIAYGILGLSPLFVMLAGLAAVVGHNWMLFLKFSGGKGMGPTFGALAVLMPVYGYWYTYFIFLGVIVVPFVITRNVALSMGVGLLFLPLITWLGTQSGLATLMAVSLGVLIGAKYLPTAMRTGAKAGNVKDFIFEGRHKDGGS
ncbi:glycerol-3-phosphate acyltransferase [Chloroflexota bacterium]